MLTFIELEQYIKLVKKTRDNNKNAYDAGVNLSEYSEPFYAMNTILLNALMKQDQRDFLDWWVYDCDMRFNNTTECTDGRFMDIRMWDSSGKPFVFLNLQDIYNHLLSI